MTIPVPILLYHSIAADTAPRYREWAVRPETFAAHMVYLADGGYTPLTVTQLTRALVDRRVMLPDRPVVITVDDGLADFYTAALPVLARHGFAATLYITTGFVGDTARWLSADGEGDRPMLSWRQIAEIQDGGIECGAHTRRHPQLDILPRGAAWDEINRCKCELEQHLGRAVATFAYPHGYYSPTVRRFVQEAGYSSACAVKKALSATTDDRFALARLIVTEKDTADIAAFGRLLAGDGLAIAPAGERLRTRGWRVARRLGLNTLAQRRTQTAGVDGTQQGLRHTDIPIAAMADTVQSAPAARRPAVTGEPPALPATPPACAPSDHSRAVDGHGQSARDEGPRQQEPEPLLVLNLLGDITTLGPLLLDALQRASWLDAYLLAAGINQIVEDYLHPDPYFLHKAADYLARMGSPAGPVAAGTARSVGAAAAEVGRRRAPARGLVRAQADLATFVGQLADAAIRPAFDAPSHRADLSAQGEALLAALSRGPARLLREVLRLPSCFRSFDQQPADLERIARGFAQRWPDRRRPLVIVGVRTSGSYLAPLYAAFLQAEGYRDVRFLTIRPNRPLLSRERAVLREAIGRDGLVLLTDDPPVSAASLAKAAKGLERIGIPTRSIVLLLQLFGAHAVLPPAVQHYEAVLLPWDEWAVHEQLTEPSVRAALNDLLAPATTATAVERLPLPPRGSARGHVRALYHVRLADWENGCQWERRIVVTGAGLGYFGAHALAVARALRGYVPEIYGFRGILSYRAWLPEERQAPFMAAGEESTWAASMVAYIAARHRALAVSEDISLRLLGRLPAWEAASNIASRAFGRGWLVVRMPVVDPAIKHLLRCQSPSIVDGHMMPSCWFTEGREEHSGDILPGGYTLLKAAADERAFSNRDLSCYDAAFDVAGIVAGVESAGIAADVPALVRHLRAAFARMTGEHIGAERWLLYQLVLLWDQRYRHPHERPAIDRALSRALQRYFAEIYFRDVAAPAGGGLCALDLDGVLETSPLRCPGLTPAGAATLRALSLHGYRPILATGRSLDEVRERCDAYQLAGGVAEYGAVIYNRGTGSVRHLLSESERAALDRLRAALCAIDGVYLDADYRHAVRAYRLDGSGHRHGLDAEAIGRALAAAGVERRVRPIPGEAQTDFMAARIDKGVGLRLLAADLGAGEDMRGQGADMRGQGADGASKPLALAVGDTVSDVPMLELATLALAPANADAAVRRAGVPVLKLPYQAGLALAAARLLGHPPGGCPLCRGPRVSRDTRLLLTVLAAQETGNRGIIRQAFLLAAQVATLVVADRLRRASEWM